MIPLEDPAGPDQWHELHHHRGFKELEGHIIQGLQEKGTYPTAKIAQLAVDKVLKCQFYSHMGCSMVHMRIEVSHHQQADEQMTEVEPIPVVPANRRQR